MEGGIAFKNGKKPENLLCKIIEMTTSVEDIVLDSFLGSGTTTAVAHKMNRKYIGIEMGEHAYSHVHKRMKTVVDGNGSGRVSVKRLGGKAEVVLSFMSWHQVL